MCDIHLCGHLAAMKYIYTYSCANITDLAKEEEGDERIMVKPLEREGESKIVSRGHLQRQHGGRTVAHGSS